MMVLLIALVFRQWHFGTSAWIGVPVYDANVSVASDAGCAPHGNCMVSTTYLSTSNSVWNLMSLLTALLSIAANTGEGVDRRSTGWADEEEGGSVRWLWCIHDQSRPTGDELKYSFAFNSFGVHD